MLLRLWNAFRSGGMGAGHLPGAGGYGDQDAYTMAAIEHCCAAEAKIRKRQEDFRNLGRGARGKPQADEPWT